MSSILSITVPSIVDSLQLHPPIRKFDVLYNFMQGTEGKALPVVYLPHTAYTSKITGFISTSTPPIVLRSYGIRSFKKDDGRIRRA